jgi:hypothetical protein
MTGTVAGVTACQWDAGGQWRVISANCSTISSRPYQCANWVQGGAGPDCLAGFSNSDSELWDLRPARVVGYRVRGVDGEPAWVDLNHVGCA